MSGHFPFSFAAMSDFFRQSILAGINMAGRINGKEPLILPRDTMSGALTAYISDEYNGENFQPMGCNMGILPELPERIKDKKLKYQAYAERAAKSLENVLDEYENK